MIHNIKDILMGDQLNSLVATLAVLSWWWLPYLQDVSTIAALLLPFFGGLWLVSQVIVHWIKFFRGK